MDFEMYQSYMKNSELFASITKKKTVKYPTSNNFNSAELISKFNSIKQPCKRDEDIKNAALRFNKYLTETRNLISTLVNKNYSKQQLTEAFCILVNTEYVKIFLKMMDESKKQAKTKEFTHVDIEKNRLLKTLNNQTVTADNIITASIDSIPNWLFLLETNVFSKESVKAAVPLGIVFLVLSLTSIEQSLKELWNSVIWEGCYFAQNSDPTLLRVSDKNLAEKLNAWQARSELDRTQDTLLGYVVDNIDAKDIVDFKNIFNISIVSIERKHRNKRKLIVGSLKDNSKSIKSHLLELKTLLRLYTGLFIEEKLFVESILFDLTCLDLLKAWWVIVDIVNIEFNRMSNDKNFHKNFKKSALNFSKCELFDALIDTLKFSEEKTNFIIDIFTVNFKDMNYLFRKSVWSKPLIKNDDNSYFIIIAPLRTGCAVRRIEDWLELGGITDKRDFKKRGKAFENHAKAAIKTVLENNNLINDYEIVEISSKLLDQEIDILFRIGNIIFIGEIKCFLTPADPIDRFNYLDSIVSAVSQTNKKFKAVANNCNKIFKSHTDYKCIPLLILNQSFFAGEKINGVYITDLKYLGLILGQGSYKIGTMVMKEGNIDEYVDLYSSQTEFELKIQHFLENIETVNRYKSTIKWLEQPFKPHLVSSIDFLFEQSYFSEPARENNSLFSIFDKDKIATVL